MSVQNEPLVPATPRVIPSAKAQGEIKPGVIVFLVLLAIALVLPAMLKGFVVFQLTQTMVYAIAILGLNLLTGINGQFSLGHSAFYAIGAYTAAILMEHAGVGYVMDAAGRGASVLHRRVPVRSAGASARWRLSRARDLRARGGDAAASEAVAVRALDRRRAGHRHHEARRALRPVDEPGHLALLLHALSSASFSSSSRATSCIAAPAAR